MFAYSSVPSMQCTLRLCVNKRGNLLYGYAAAVLQIQRYLPSKNFILFNFYANLLLYMRGRIRFVVHVELSDVDVDNFANFIVFAIAINRFK